MTDGDMRHESGGIVTGWLLQLVLLMAVLAFVGYEVISVAITAVTLEDDAREVARAAADAYGSREDLGAAREAAQSAAGTIGVQLQQLVVEGEVVRVQVTEQAPTVLAHRLGPLRELTRPTAQGRASWRR